MRNRLDGTVEILSIGRHAQVIKGEPRIYVERIDLEQYQRNIKALVDGGEADVALAMLTELESQGLMRHDRAEVIRAHINC
jgi:hypothetical protein